MATTQPEKCIHCGKPLTANDYNYRPNYGTYHKACEEKANGTVVLNDRRISNCPDCGARIVLRWISGFESTVHKCPDNPKVEAEIDEAYARYDSDPRVSGVDDMDAFREAVRPLVKDQVSSVNSHSHH